MSQFVLSVVILSLVAFSAGAQESFLGSVLKLFEKLYSILYNNIF